MKNKGFSLVELIIVIAIMAILAAAIAPALIRYIDKSRRSDDVAAAETVNTATQAAFSNEDAYDEVQEAFPTTSGGVTWLAAASQGADFDMITTAGISNSGATFLAEVNSSTNGGPSLKYKKNGASKWYIGANFAGKPVVGIGISGSKTLELQPSIDKSYK